MEYYLAIDLGASSGRHIIGYKENGEIKLDEVHRFYNYLTIKDGRYTWDIDLLYKEIIEGIKKAFAKYKNINSLAIDSWGVDYVLLNNDEIIKPAYAYRDGRTKQVIDKVHEIIPFSRLYEITGIQFQEFNTIYQLYDDKLNGRLKNATDFLLIPEFFNYMLTGNKVKEFTDESTGGMIDPKTNDFSKEIIDKLGFNPKLFSKMEQAGFIVGQLKDEISKEVGGQLNVVLCPSHDTASSFDAIDNPSDSAFLSSGTWSILGTKLENACTTSDAFKANFSNEGGVNYTRFLKNIMGMWIANNIIKEENISIVEATELARKSNYDGIINVNDESLYAPSNMKEAVIALIKKNNLPETNSLGDVISCVFHSLAYSYNIAINEMSKILNKKFTSLYIVGGGAKNTYINELSEKYCNMKVVALPLEATAIGNIKSQIERRN